MTKTLSFTIPFYFFTLLSCAQQQKNNENSSEAQNLIVGHTLSTTNTTEQEALLPHIIETKTPSTILVDGYSDNDKQWLLDNIFIHSLINEADIPKEKTDLSKLINEDDSLVKISENKIKLPCQDTVIVFENLIEDEYGYYSTHQYIGKIEALNAYLLFVEYLEISNHIIVDIKTGKVNYLDPYLIFSPDGRFMISAGNGSPDTQQGYCTIYSIEHGKLEDKAVLNYDDNWATKEYASHNDGLWSEDDNIYIPLQQNQYAQDNEDNKMNCLKIQINLNKLKAPTKMK